MLRILVIVAAIAIAFIVLRTLINRKKPRK